MATLVTTKATCSEVSNTMIEQHLANDLKKDKCFGRSRILSDCEHIQWKICLSGYNGHKWVAS